MVMTFDKLRELVRDRTWYRARGVFAFLVEAPLTLGHSQLVVRASWSDTEERSFVAAVPHIANCIRVLRRRLPSRDRKSSRSLTRYTGTSGRYRRTLVLKASADEPKGMYKVHLVPCFASHFNAANRLFQLLNDADDSEPGGLLHWIGQRERLVDNDMRYGRVDKQVKARITAFNLEQLVSTLVGDIA